MGVRVGVELKKWLRVRVGVRVELILLRLCNPAEQAKAKYIVVYLSPIDNLTELSQNNKSLILLPA